MNTFFRTVAAALALLIAAPGAMAAQTHAPATKLGDVDVSLFCPAGSAWYPKDGGSCLTCGNNVKPKLGLCPGIRPARTAKAVFSHRRKGLICKGRPFKRPKTKECWVCPKGYARVPGVKFNKKGICWSAPRPYNRKPKVALKISLKDMLNPARMAQESRNLGCKGYHKNAVFAPAGGGTCWVCPRSHPKRTLRPIISKRACGLASCGGNGERACLITERLRACNKDLSHNIFKGTCEARAKLSCKPLLGSLAAMRAAISKANEIAGGMKGQALDKVPGAKALLGLMDKGTGKLQEKLNGLIAHMPVDKLTADLDLMFKSPEEVKMMQEIVLAIAARQDELMDLMLDPDVTCDNPEALTALLARTINQATGYGDRTDAGQTRFGELMDIISPVSTAHATRKIQVYAPFLRGKAVSLTSAASIYLKKGPAKLPIDFAFEYKIEIGDEGDLNVSVNFVGGVDVPSKASWEESGSVSVYFSFLPKPKKADCEAAGGISLGLFNLVGISGNRCGLAGLSVNLGGADFTRDKVETIFTSSGPRQLLALLPEMKQSARVKGESYELRGPSPELSISLGFNGTKTLFYIVGESSDRSAFAP